ncbi:MAG: sulfoxide reductase heme-binding subunit YedZ [Rhodanobacteraceae bacterium]|nr:sulfoxide reductase heme-binding subunit YedZ [Rhodanobacteraceae bacterium]
MAVTKVVLFLLCLLPAAWLCWEVLVGDSGPDPVARIVHETGAWTLRFLLITLAITPLRRFFGWNVLIRFRRMLGLYAFFYASLHFASYLLLDLGAFWAQLLTDIVKRPYITVGFSAWLLLVPLAITSTNAMMRRLGKRWQTLHRLSYLIAVLGVLHFVWLVKADLREPLIYAAILARADAGALAPRPSAAEAEQSRDTDRDQRPDQDQQPRAARLRSRRFPAALSVLSTALVIRSDRVQGLGDLDPGTWRRCPGHPGRAGASVCRALRSGNGCDRTPTGRR